MVGGEGKFWILDIECAADLLVKTGAKLESEHDKASLKVDSYMAKIERLKTNENLPSRVRFLLHDIIDLRKAKWVTESSQANERINRIKNGNQLKSVDEVRKETITKLYGADPRMANLPNRLMDELVGGEKMSNKKGKNSRGRDKKDNSGFGSFFRSPSGTRENSRDRESGSREERGSNGFNRSGSFDGRVSKLVNKGLVSQGARGSIGKQTTTPQKQELEDREGYDKYGDKIDGYEDNTKKDEQNNRFSREKRESISKNNKTLKKPTEKPVVVKRSRSPAVQPLKPEPVPRRNRNIQLQNNISMVGMNERDVKEPQKRDTQGRATWNEPKSNSAKIENKAPVKKPLLTEEDLKPIPLEQAYNKVKM